MWRSIFSIFLASAFASAVFFTPQSLLSSAFVLMISYVWIRRERRFYFYILKLKNYRELVLLDRSQYYPFVAFIDYDFPKK